MSDEVSELLRERGEIKCQLSLLERKEAQAALYKKSKKHPKKNKQKQKGKDKDQAKRQKSVQQPLLFLKTQQSGDFSSKVYPESDELGDTLILDKD